MERLAAESLVALTRATGDTGLGLRQWRPLFDTEGTWTETILVQCTDENELRRLHAAIQGKQVTVGGHSAAVGVHSNFVHLPS